MKAAAGTTSRTARSNPALRSVAAAISDAAAFARVNEHAFGRHVNVHVRAGRDLRRRAQVQSLSARRHHLDERIAAAVFDVVDTRGNYVARGRLGGDRDLLGTHRDSGALAIERELP